MYNTCIVVDLVTFSFLQIFWLSSGGGKKTDTAQYLSILRGNMVPVSLSHSAAIKTTEVRRTEWKVLLAVEKRE